MELKNNNVQENEPLFIGTNITTEPDLVYRPVSIEDYAAKIDVQPELTGRKNAIDFANEINSNFIADFENSQTDKMCHVSTFCYCGGKIYASYYASVDDGDENPNFQKARLAYCNEDDLDNKTILDIMSVGDIVDGKKVTGVYDTILMKKDDDDEYIYVLWTASIENRYYRLYRTFNMKTETLGEIRVNRFKVGDITNDFCDRGIKNALTANGKGFKYTFADIGIMQKLSSRIENGTKYYYSGAYSGNFTCIIKSKDFITWEYVAQPDEGANGTGFKNATKWENAVYVIGDKVYYFVRQWDPLGGNNGIAEGSYYGILTTYDLVTGEWHKPVLVGDSQSRSDFIVYNDELYLFHAPTNRNHIGILKINTDDIAKSEIVLQADMQGSCFYPFIQYNSKGELCMSYTVSRKHIRLASFTLSKYI